MERLALLFLCLTWVATAAPSNPSKLSPEDLIDGGYILYFRHTEADVGVDCKDAEQGEWWKSDDSSKTRQLSTFGKQQAQIIGQAFRRLKIPVGLILCSEFRRTQDTSQLMGLGESRLEPNLTPLTSLGELGPRLRPLLAATPEPGTNTVLVAHGHVLPEFEDLEEGSAIVFQPGEKQPLGTISYEDWQGAAGDVGFVSHNQKDRFEIEGSTLTIKSRTGIGEVTLCRLKDDWPEFTALRFEYIGGRGMQRLEGLWVKTDKTKHQLHELSKKVRNGAVEVTLPSELSRSVDFIKIHWVDVYR